jgi:zinc transporter 1/2/3
MAAGTITSAVMLIINCGLIPFVIAHGGSDDGDSSDSPNLRAKGLILVKIWCLIIVFASTFAGGISPYFYRWNESFLLLGTQFAAGVFLGTAWMHFLSDSAEKFEDLTDKTYPFAFMLCTAGYLVTMLADLIIVWVYEKQDQSSSIHSANPLQKTAGIGDTESGVTTLNSQDLHTVDGGVQMVKAASLVKKTSIGDSLLLVLALCFHSVFEGIAIGVAATKHDAWRALWTVCLHKIFAAIAMGIALLRIIPDRPFLSCAAYAFAFAISSPVGIGIGILIDATTQGRVADWIYAISMAFACGVFVYVAINHLLLKGVIQNPNKGAIPFDKPFYKYLAAVTGAGLIAVVMNWD